MLRSLWLPMVAAILISVPTHGRAQVAIDVDVDEGLGCALYDTGEVYCFGALPGSDVTLPFHAAKVTGLPFAVALSVGRYGPCAVDRSGGLWCWGFSLHDSVRKDAAVFSSQPLQITGLPPVRSVDGGFNHICALTADGDVWCWGENICGEVGDGTDLLRSDPVRVRFTGKARSVSAGVNNTCVASDVGNGTVACWGSDNPTMPGRPLLYETMLPEFLPDEVLRSVVTVGNGRNFACGITDAGKVLCWGSNYMGQLGNPLLAQGSGMVGVTEVKGMGAVSDIDVDYFSSCAVADQRVYCWGNLPFGEDGTAQDVPKAVIGSEGATRVGLGSAFACAIIEGRVKCWGEEENGGEAVIAGMTPTTPVEVPGLP